MSTEHDLSNFRLEQAEECFMDAKLSYEQGRFKNAANRIYYCVFHCMRSILALERIDFKSHKGVISKFREKYIKTGLLDRKLSIIIDVAFKQRTDGDYKDFITFTDVEISEQLENAEFFLNKTKEFLHGGIDS